MFTFMVIICAALVINIMRLPKEFRTGIMPGIAKIDVDTTSKYLALEERVSVLESSFKIRCIQSPIYQYMRPIDFKYDTDQ